MADIILNRFADTAFLAWLADDSHQVFHHTKRDSSVMGTSTSDPPDEILAEIIDHLKSCSPSTLRKISQYAVTLADYEACSDQSTDGEDTYETPDEVPPDATLKLDEDDLYYYWEWESGGETRTKYKNPARW